MTKPMPSIFAVMALYALYALHALAYGFFFGLIGGLFGPTWLIVCGVIGTWMGCRKADRILTETYRDDQ